MNTGNENEFRWLAFDPSDVIYLVRKHILLLFCLPLALAGLAIVIAKQLTPVFSTQSVFYIRPNFDAELHGETEGGTRGGDDADSLRSIAEAMTSDTVILKMIENLDLKNVPDYLPAVDVFPGKLFSRKEGEISDTELLKEVRSRYRATLRPETRLVELTVDDYSKERTVQISRELASAFLNHLREVRSAREQSLRSTLQSQAEAVLKKVFESEERLKQFRLQHPDTFVEQDSTMFQERILQQSSTLNQSRADSSRMEAVLSTLEKIDPAKDPYRVFQILDKKGDPLVSELMRLEAATKSEMAVAEGAFTDRHPEYKAALTRLREVEESIKAYAAELKDGVKSEYLAAGQRTEALRRNLADSQSTFVNFKSTSAEFQGLKQEIDRNWNTHTKLQERITELDLAPVILPSFMTPVSHPVLPNKKTRPRTLFGAAAGLLMGAVCAGAWIWWKNRRGLPFTCRSQSGRDLGIQQIGEIQFARKVKPEEACSVLENSPDLMEVVLAASGAGVIHITGVKKHEEANLFSSAFARVSGNCGLQTLLVTFDEGGKPGSIVPAGENASTMTLPVGILLDSDAFKNGIKRLLEQFDRIIFNTTRIPQLEAKLAVATFSEMTILAIDGEGSQSRAEYRRFVEALELRGIECVASVYLRAGNFSGERFPEPAAGISSFEGPQPKGPQPQPLKERFTTFLPWKFHPEFVR